MKTVKNLAVKFRIIVPGILVFVLSVTAGSCPTTKTLFQSNFDSAANSPPSSTQTVGTASVHGAPSNVLVVSRSDLTPAKWLEIKRPTADSDVSGFQGKFSEFGGDGSYTFSTVLFIPSSSKVATVQFESFNQPVSDLSSFLHLDFLENNSVQIDDGPTFGTFPRDQAFIVQVKLNINETNPKADILLSGAGASGETSRDIAAPFRLKAREFGAVRIWMGFPHTGNFLANTIVVKKNV